MSDISFDDLIPKKPQQAGADLSFDDLIPSSSAPTKQAAQFGNRAGIRALPKDIQGQTLGQSLNDFKDTSLAVGTAATQGASLGFSDEMVAALRTAFGDNWEQALEAERERIRSSKEKIGDTAYTAAEFAGGAIPGAPILSFVRRMAGPGAGFVRQTVTGMAVNAPVAAVNNYGVQEGEKSVKEATGAGLLAAGVNLVLPTVGKVATGGYKLAADGIDRIKQSGALRRAEQTGTAYVPSERTQAAATRHIVDELQNSGVVRPQQLTDQLADNAIPDTPQALANARNDRLLPMAAYTASKVKNPNNGSVNIVDQFAESQRVNQRGQTQPDALRTRIMDRAGVPQAQRDPVAVERGIQVQQGRLGDQLGAVRSAGGEVSVPGVANLVDSTPSTRAAYRSAVEAASVPGPHFIPRDEIPLPHSEWAPAHQRWTRMQQEARERVAAAEREFNAGGDISVGQIDDLYAELDRVSAIPEPILLTDDNMPTAIFMSLRDNASEMAKGTANRDPSEVGMRFFGTLTDNTTGGGASSNAEAASRINRDIRHLHERREDIQAGRGILRQDPTPQAATVAETQGLNARRQADRRVGALYGAGDEIGKSSDDLNKARQQFNDPRNADAYDRISGTGMRARQISDEADRANRALFAAEQIQQSSTTRKFDFKEGWEKGAKAGIRYTYSPTGGILTGAYAVGSGRSDQARQKTVLMQLLDLSPAARNRVVDEMVRRMNLQNKEVDAAKQILIDLLGRQPAIKMGEN